MGASILVVGAGPVGLTMAAELARYRVPVRVIDKSASRTDKSKALVIWPRTLELIDRMRCAPAFVAAGLKASGANIIAGKKTLAHIKLDVPGTPFPYALMIPQSETERLMEKHLNDCGVQVERRVELTGFTAGDAGVSATLRRPDERAETIDVAWMIGCDGAHSAVRHGLNVEFEGHTQPSDWLLADTHLSGIPDSPVELSIYWHADGVLVLIPISGGRFRVIADAGEARSAALRPDPTLAEIQELLDQRGPGGIVASDPNWLASFRINERKVADYRAGRMFLAGDAAHIHSPAGGQGMNTGMQDAANLAWKLAMVYHGTARQEPLLDSYSIERSEVGRQVLKDASRLTYLAIMRGGVTQAIRNHVAHLVFGLTVVRDAMANKLTELAIGYPKSPLTVKSKHDLHPRPGERAPVLDPANPVGAGATPRFALFAGESAQYEQLIARNRDLLEPHPREPFGNAGAWLVRPDGYVAMALDAGDLSAMDRYFAAIRTTAE